MRIINLIMVPQGTMKGELTLFPEKQHRVTQPINEQKGGKLWQ